MVIPKAAEFSSRETAKNVPIVVPVILMVPEVVSASAVTCWGEASALITSANCFAIIALATVPVATSSLSCPSMYILKLSPTTEFPPPLKTTSRIIRV